MSTPISNGGPAFPEHHYFDPSRGQFGMHTTASDVGCGGMSLRDWFAGQALAGLCNGARGTGWRKSELAKDAFAFADAMIAAREGK